MADTPIQTTQPPQTTPPTQGGGGLEGWLENYFVKKAPFQIPSNGREWLASALPWVTLISLIFVLWLVSILLFSGGQYGVIGTFVGPKYRFFLYLAGAAVAVQAVLMIMALPGLFKRQRRGWKLLFYSALLWLVYDLFHWAAFVPNFFSLIWALITVTIGLYLLFQVRDYYRA